MDIYLGPERILSNVRTYDPFKFKCILENRHILNTASICFLKQYYISILIILCLNSYYSQLPTTTFALQFLLQICLEAIRSFIARKSNHHSAHSDILDIERFYSQMKNYYIVDAFTTKPFAGNPAGVVLLDDQSTSKQGGTDHADDERWMRNMAMEINQSETAFAVRRGDEGGVNSNVYSIRYFTPDGSEVALCGHATLATAHVLYTLGHVPESLRITFHAKGGTLVCRKADDGRICMVFPADVTREMHLQDDAIAQDMIDHGFEGLGRDDIVYIGRGLYDYMIVCETQKTVETIVPKSNVLEKLSHDHTIRGFIVTAPADNTTHGADFVSRFFGPGVGIPEDPVTGSAHCTLGPYWAKIFKPDTLAGLQICPKRGGTVYMDTGHENSIEISGHAVLVATATLMHNN